jgi:crotonobetainyl-CoA:carnitine CoA-transferase CaiB-like acyl-CoA transferase
MPLAESFLPVIGEFIMDYTMNGRPTGPQGNRHPSHAPHGIYPTTGEDQWIAIDVATDEEFAALCRVLAAPALATDARFRTAGGRIEHRTALDAAVGDATRGHDKEALFHALQAARVAAGPVHDDLDATRSPQLEERGFFEELTMEGVGTHRYPGIFTKWANTPNWIRTPPVKLGEHNEEVYVDLLGYPREEYDALVARGLVGTTYTPEVLKGRD